MLLYIKILLASIFSGVIWVISAEGFAMYAGVSGDLRFNGWLLALALSIGQSLGFIGVYFFGHSLLSLSKRLRDKVECFDVEKFENTTAISLLFGSVIGIPPLLVMAVISGTIRYRLGRFIVIVFTCRYLRFVLLYYFAKSLAATFGLEIPEHLALPF
jgi:membrane protein YqaA with SNARE-associated domain